MRLCHRFNLKLSLNFVTGLGIITLLSVNLSRSILAELKGQLSVISLSSSTHPPALLSNLLSCCQAEIFDLAYHLHGVSLAPAAVTAA